MFQKKDRNMSPARRGAKGGEREGEREETEVGGGKSILKGFLMI